ncbi:glycoside hydrolase family 78 protein [Halosquirtibacter laminarini]|uniref:Glycoside hydrolase family 78 protein n=1 Tax=Halosquirtibacter laminarini TaxID=3374600 RepID=A0AC61NEE2_9BACT|nr:glycoside hydrolase family 78 protein [Prolixibacteraceae bacterium]
MKTLILIILCSLSIAVVVGQGSHKATGPIHLKVDYLEQNIAVNSIAPQFSWEIPHEIKNQKKYQIVIQRLTKNGIKKIWTSKWIHSNNNTFRYTGKKLTDHSYYKWRVRVKDSLGIKSNWSRYNLFSTSFIGKETIPDAFLISHPNKKMRSPAFLKDIYIHRKIRYAKIYMASLGWTKLSINGVEIPNQHMSPAASEYEKRMLYDTKDITDELKIGKNNLHFQLSEGFGAYSIPDSTRFFNLRRKQTEKKPSLLASIFIKYEDGSDEYLYSDKTWFTNSGTLRYSNLYGGEDIDLCQNTNKDWIHVVCDKPTSKISPTKITDIKVQEEIKPIKRININKNTIIYDLGTTVTGWWKLKVRGERTDKITIRGSEKLQGKYFNGFINNKSRLNFTDNHSGQYYFRDRKTTFLLKNKDTIDLEPSFFIHSFRYIQIDLSSDNIDIIDLKGIRANHDYPITSRFKSSSEYLNKLYKNASNTFFGGINQFPLSNPNSEIYPWTGDVSCYWESLDAMTEMTSFWIKWLQDIKDSQHTDGSIPETAPNYRDLNHASEPAWSQDYINLILGVYHRTGDQSILEKHINSVKRLIDYYTNNKNQILKLGMWGDHMQPSTYGIMNSRGQTSEIIPFISTSIYHRMLCQFIEMGKVTGNLKWVKEYSIIAKETKRQFTEYFWNDSLKIYNPNNQNKKYDNTQTINAIALQCKIVPDSIILNVHNTLMKNITVTHNYKLTTGIHGTKALFDVLERNGDSRILYKILMDEHYPGWRYQIDKGATSLWQSFSGNGDLSHAMFGGPPIRFIFRNILGVHADYIGINKTIDIKPFIPNNLESAEGVVNTFAGNIDVSWKKVDHKILFKIIIPGNINAKFKYKEVIKYLKPGVHNIII